MSRTGITLSKYESSHLGNHCVAAFWFGWGFFSPKSNRTESSLFLQTEVSSIMTVVANIKKIILTSLRVRKGGWTFLCPSAKTVTSILKHFLK